MRKNIFWVFIYTHVVPRHVSAFVYTQLCYTPLALAPVLLVVNCDWYIKEQHAVATGNSCN